MIVLGVSAPFNMTMSMSYLSCVNISFFLHFLTEIRMFLLSGLTKILIGFLNASNSIMVDWVSLSAVPVIAINGVPKRGAFKYYSTIHVVIRRDIKKAFWESGPRKYMFTKHQILLTESKGTYRSLLRFNNLLKILYFLN